ncbi:MAG: biotin transporter BioY [Candidatus Omnitrophica bacterium]|nr:biotin transporter BioY [Candidatus Omnitrophota bacterium]
MMDMVLRKEIPLSKEACRYCGIAVFAVLTIVGAFIRIPLPFTPVPVTLQTFFVLLSGAVLGGMGGAGSQGMYMLLGLAGIPLFTGTGSGLAYVCGPTGGYLAGFIAASVCTGRLMNNSRHTFLSALGIFIAADMILFLCGLLWLKVLYGYSFTVLVYMGLLPFIPGEIVKITVAVALYEKIKTRSREIFA